MIAGRRLVAIRWTDSCAANEWRELADAEFWQRAPGDIWTVGWLIHETAEHVTVAASVAVDQMQASGDMTIPRGVIREVRVLSEG